MTHRFETFVLSINRIYRCIQKIKSQEMTELGLKGTHVMCLFQLRQNPEGLTAAELSSFCMEDKAAISRAISRLEELEMVQLQENSGGRRYRARIYLTDAGKMAAEKVAALVERAVQRGGEGLSDAQRETFYDALGVIARNLEGVCAAEGTV